MDHDDGVGIDSASSFAPALELSSDNPLVRCMSLLSRASSSASCLRYQGSQ